MLLQYPKITPSLFIATFEDYHELHEGFVQAYKVLYEEVAVFSTLPEKFILEADPVIQKFIEDTKKPSSGRPDDGRLQVILRFIDRFHSFTDKATEMFTGHQALAEQVAQYLNDLTRLSQLPGKRPIEEIEDGYIQLIPQLEKLNQLLACVNTNIDRLKGELEQLKSLWKQVARQIHAGVIS